MWGARWSYTGSQADVENAEWANLTVTCSTACRVALEVTAEPVPLPRPRRKPVVKLDLPVAVPPHNCIHVKGKHSGRINVSNHEALAVRKAFREEVRLRIPRHLRRRICEPVRLRVRFWHRGPRPADGDNLQKELLDALVNAEVLHDDRYVKACHWSIEDDGPKVQPRVTVEIIPLAPPSDATERPSMST